MDKINCLRAFVSVIECGGFSESARRLNVSKALISKQLVQLEESLGVRLLHRTTRRVSPTSSGQAYYEQCRPLLDELDELDASVQSRDKELQGELRISAPTTYAEMHVLPIITQYTKQHPDVKIHLDLTDRFVNLVEERIDLAIRIGELEESTLVSRRIGEIRMFLCAAPEYLARHGTPEFIESLSSHQFIVDSNHPEGKNLKLKIEGNSTRVQVKDRIEVNNARAARDLVLAGNGIGYLPSFAVENHLRKGKLVQLFKEHRSEAIGIYAVYLHRKHLSLKVRKLLDLLVENIKS